MHEGKLLKTVTSFKTVETPSIDPDTGKQVGFYNKKIPIGTEYVIDGKPTDDQIAFLRVATTKPETTDGIQKALEMLAKICPISEKKDVDTRHVRIATLTQDLHEENISEFVVNLQCKQYRREAGARFFPDHGDFFSRCDRMQKNFNALYEAIIAPKIQIEDLRDQEPKQKSETPWCDKEDSEKYAVACEYIKLVYEMRNQKTFQKYFISMFMAMHKIPDHVDLKACRKKHKKLVDFVA